MVFGLLALHVPLIGNSTARAFTADALFSGIGAFLVFVPQIFVLTFVIGLLGVGARAAVAAFAIFVWDFDTGGGGPVIVVKWLRFVVLTTF